MNNQFDSNPNQSEANDKPPQSPQENRPTLSCLWQSILVLGLVVLFTVGQLALFSQYLQYVNNSFSSVFGMGLK